MWKDFFEGLARLKESGKPFVVATVVKVSGSTYRRPGARVLITEEGISTGLISGGCFESDLIERAKQVLQTNQATLVTFDTTSPDDLVFGLGLGCTGVAHILLQPVHSKQPTPDLDFLAESVSNRQEAALVTVFHVDGVQDLSIGSTVRITENQQESETIKNRALLRLFSDAGRAVLQERQSQSQNFKVDHGTVEALSEYIELPQRLLIFGAGPDAVPLVRMSRELGWNVIVADRRPAFAKSERFAGATVILTEPEDLPSRLRIDSSFAAVVMNHHFETDQKALQMLLRSPVFYIGLLGPSSKTDLLFSKMREQGFEPSNEQFRRLFSPVGLDVGAETPEEIAISILSEIQAVKSGSEGGFLRTRSGPIHRR